MRTPAALLSFAALSAISVMLIHCGVDDANDAEILGSNVGGNDAATPGKSAAGGAADDQADDDLSDSSAATNTENDADDDDDQSDSSDSLDASPSMKDAESTKSDSGAPGLAIACPSGFGTEVFRDDFDGTSIDKTKWQVVEQNNGGAGSFTQLTKMIANRVTVSGGRLHVASQRHCQDPYSNKAAPKNPAQCAGTNYYSGGWIKTNSGYAAGKGVVIFLAKMPAPVEGMFPALWARNTEGDQNYGELDLIETWWDFSGKGKKSDENLFAVTTWMGTGAAYHTSSNGFGPFTNLVKSLHVWEAEWDSTAATPAIKYYYRDTPSATRVLLRTVTSTTAGLSGNVSAAQFKQILTYVFRPYVDFAVQPDSSYHVGPDTAASYDPEDVEVDSVIVCKP